MELEQIVWPAASARPIRGAGRRHSGASVVVRITGAAELPITTDAIAGITRIIDDVTAGEEVAVDQLAPADVLSDTLQTLPCWTLDERGYNFRDDLPAAAFADGDHVYRIRYRLTLAGEEEPFALEAVLPAEA